MQHLAQTWHRAVVNGLLWNQGGEREREEGGEEKVEARCTGAQLEKGEQQGRFGFSVPGFLSVKFKSGDLLFIHSVSQSVIPQIFTEWLPNVRRSARHYIPYSYCPSFYKGTF